MKLSIYNKLKFYKKRSFSCFYICNKNYFSPAFQQLLENPDEFMKAHILKEDKTFTTTVALVKIDNKSLVIKRYNLKSFFHALKRAIQPSRAARCWYYSHLLQTYNINTPAPIAMIEKRFGFLRRQAYFISEYILGPDGFYVFRDHPTVAEDAKIYAKNTIELINSLHSLNISHGDFKASNFIYNNSVPYLIDLDAMRQHKSRNKGKIKLEKDRKRFLLNWQDLPATEYFNDLEF